MAPSPPPGPGDGARPPLGTWGQLYALVISSLVAEIALLYVLSRAFR
ncbi:MAG TPA: hypothetical protein VMK42_18450 [Anaeromyxobacteraceae bacterium]|nr:hypothetical protein [Anaeromyxobacteraceae bacterium]